MFDFSVAFDNVEHSLLLETLSSIDVSCHTLLAFLLYLAIASWCSFHALFLLPRRELIAVLLARPRLPSAFTSLPKQLHGFS